MRSPNSRQQIVRLILAGLMLSGCSTPLSAPVTEPALVIPSPTSSTDVSTQASSSVLALLSDHAPAPPLGPPPASTEIPGFDELNLQFARGIILDEVDKSFAQINEQSPRYHVHWSEGAKPTECGHDCIGSPYLSQTTFINQPNQWFARVQGYLDFDLELIFLPLPPTQRKIRSTISLTVSCDGWRDGSGELNMEFDIDRPMLLDDRPLQEDIVAFLFPLFSDLIDSAVEARLRSADLQPVTPTPGPGPTPTPEPPTPCNRLGVVRSESIVESITWNRSQPVVGPEAGTHSFATVVFNSIKRVDIFDPTIDPAASIYFDFFVNGQQIGVPQNGTLNLLPGTTLSLRDVSASITSPVDTVQVIVADSLGGGGWIEVPRSNVSEVTQVVLTHRAVLHPTEPIPVPGGPASGQKPYYTDVHEFEISFTISWRETLTQP